ncbi:phosphoenolpyruvate-protein phosphotransferase [Xylanimonas cellulosilytica DSM 15894]|uniref:Phosphoenolpyruvate-protein phosphotransferase n=1 Tax=Xylanimonas cellulosilytica (strain DSM 15894 / JCM 12276 / CECT 5975 / KCTC 9989 / LMG 20990 / NBRC 107835 / XIL07) TaxID=446471 RepID=D1C0J9_XYLCX|nr:phosphoenolpyruvate--protein phosphotransferase [Xylanimonas cellulosilytica]ACZ32202.1 phosphoenolpyruvate-protein phosphotransferase [Xylanimonas cellulosilytica DSM 15894]
MTSLQGVPVSPGRAAGVVVTMPAPLPEPALARLPEGSDVEAAADRVAQAARTVTADLLERAGRASGTAADVLTVTAAMAADPTLATTAAGLVREDRETPERAVWDAAQSVVEQLEALGGHLAERARDVRDVRDRIIAELTGQRPPGVPEPGHPFVLVAHDLAPADTATLDPGLTLALVTEGGGPTSHTAILARALGIPAVVAVTGAARLRDGETVLVDGGRGTVERDPTPDAVAAASVARVHRAVEGQGHTADGVHIELLANVADAGSAKAAAAAGAEGVGLFRTEFLFLGRPEEPSVAEQTRAYHAVLDAFAGRKVVVRTLDAGADKPLPFLTTDGEPNPALGVRGLRTAVAHPDVLERQLEAIAAAAASADAQVWVMAPMVATPDEADRFVDRCAAHGLTRAGVMVEVPAAALQSRWLLDRATFASLGTNDLTQYAMAADRELGALAELSTSWQPAVLRLVAATCDGAHIAELTVPEGRSRPVGVCGEAAGDPALAPVLVGLGVTSLSMAPAALGDVAAVLATTSMDRCRQLARLALASRDAWAARRAVRAALPELDALGL